MQLVSSFTFPLYLWKRPEPTGLVKLTKDNLACSLSNAQGPVPIFGVASVLKKENNNYVRHVLSMPHIVTYFRKKTAVTSIKNKHTRMCHVLKKNTGNLTVPHWVAVEPQLALQHAPSCASRNSCFTMHPAAESRLN